MTADYFDQLNKSLKSYTRAIPVILIDLDRLDRNIDTLRSNWKESMDFRVVVKSLPSPELISYVMKRANTNKIMVFHQPFLTDISTICDLDSDILMGKPMPVKTAAYFYNNLICDTQQFNPYKQIQWLVDTKERIAEYINLAESLKQKLRLNMEIDVGLHRGGFENLDSIRDGLELITENDKQVSFSGFMGYDPHVVKLPKIVRTKEKALKLANSFYYDCIDLVKSEFANLWNEDLTLNGAGSPTLELHQSNESPLNDISAGSCLVKPTDFDIPTLTTYEPASFIATPILKKLKGTNIPGLEKAKSMFGLLDSNKRQSYFIYGGFWKANFCYPTSLKPNNLFGYSTNQNMVNAPDSTELEVDDFIFLRPHQSEFVMLQFGNILTIRNGQISDEWGVLKNH